MKLINPTDDELNAAFAEKVAGWFRAERLGKQVLYDPEGGHVLIGDTRCMPQFTHSADAVLPWLERWRDSGKGYVAMATIHSAAMQRTGWVVQVRDAETGPLQEIIHWSLPRAAVIALLRAHGVEVEFTDSK